MPRKVSHQSSLEQLMDATRVAEMLCISKRTLYRLIAEGLFPQPIKLGAVSRWRSSEVSAFIERSSMRRESRK